MSPTPLPGGASLLQDRYPMDDQLRAILVPCAAREGKGTLFFLIPSCVGVLPPHPRLQPLPLAGPRTRPLPPRPRAGNSSATHLEEEPARSTRLLAPAAPRTPNAGVEPEPFHTLLEKCICALRARELHLALDPNPRCATLLCTMDNCRLYARPPTQRCIAPPQCICAVRSVAAQCICASCVCTRQGLRALRALRCGACGGAPHPWHPRGRAQPRACCPHCRWPPCVALQRSASARCGALQRSASARCGALQRSASARCVQQSYT